jgi:ubiquinone biosynthesis protein COQ4
MAKHMRVSQLPKLIASSFVHPNALIPLYTRSFSVLNRPSPNYEGHVPLTITERVGLALGSGVGSFIDPRRAGM